MWLNYNFYHFKPTPEELAKLALEKPENMQLNEEVITQIHQKFQGLSIEDAKKIIFEVTSELVNDLKVKKDFFFMIRTRGGWKHNF